MKYSIIELPTRKVNRLLSRATRSSPPMWCWKCDRDVVHLGDKCATCGTQNGKKKFKKRELP